MKIKDVVNYNLLYAYIDEQDIASQLHSYYFTLVTLLTWTSVQMTILMTKFDVYWV